MFSLAEVSNKLREPAIPESHSTPTWAEVMAIARLKLAMPIPDDEIAAVGRDRKNDGLLVSVLQGYNNTLGLLKPDRHRSYADLDLSIIREAIVGASVVLDLTQGILVHELKRELFLSNLDRLAMQAAYLLTED